MKLSKQQELKIIDELKKELEPYQGKVLTGNYKNGYLVLEIFLPETSEINDPIKGINIEFNYQTLDISKQQELKIIDIIKPNFSFEIKIPTI